MCVLQEREWGAHEEEKTIEDLLGPNTVMNTAIIHNVATTFMEFHRKNHHGTFDEDMEEGFIALTTDSAATKMGPPEGACSRC